jgi:hypothetical protein
VVNLEDNPNIHPIGHKGNSNQTPTWALILLWELKHIINLSNQALI